MIEKQAFEQIFRCHYDGMFRLARRMLGSDEESKDVVSDVFAQLLNSHADLRPDTLQGFLLTSVRNRCVNLLAHKQREQVVQVELRPLQQETSQEPKEQEQLDALHRCTCRAVRIIFPYPFFLSCKMRITLSRRKCKTRITLFHRKCKTCITLFYRKCKTHITLFACKYKKKKSSLQSFA